MSYFNHAYKKTMLLTESIKSSGNASALLAGELAMVNANTYVATNAVPAAGFLLVQGNFNKTAALTNANKLSLDAIGGNALHGGYAESIKSKLIKPKYITRLWKEVAQDFVAQTSVITLTDGCFTCTNHAQLRIDLKGDRVMRALNRNFYHVLDMTKCCTGESPTAPTALEIMTEMAAQINEHSIMMNFISAAVTSAVVGGVTTATLTITLLEGDETTFSDCSIDTRDWYATQPLVLIVTEVDNEGDACSTGCFKNSEDANLPATGQTTIVQADSVSGETVLRDLILDGRYRQDGGWNQGNRDSARFREIQKADKLLAAVNRAGKYTLYYLQHSVPRFNNPTGVFDNDQYVICVAVDSALTAQITAMNTLWGSIATGAALTVETPGTVV